MSGPSSDGPHIGWPYSLKRSDAKPGENPIWEAPAFRPKNAALRWFEARLPIVSLVFGAGVTYPTPRNLNYFWTFGGILTFILGVQIVTGIILAMNYTPQVDMAFNSIEHIMRDVNYGWLLRYVHMNGASMFFIAVYIHMFRGLYYGSYKAPREVLWILGVIIYLLMMATGFLGYTLPWGQMSFWGATVITNFFSAFPVIGDPLVTWLWGGYAVGNPTLNRFFSLHYLLPFAIAAVVVLHIWALHVVGQNNPTGVDPKTDKDVVPFTPYATMKDGFAMSVFCVFFAWFIFYVPNYLGHSDNYIPANPGVTPAHIVPEWYYLPFYAILRAIPNKLLGVLALFGSIIILAFLPWLDTSKVRSSSYRPLYKQFFWIFVAVCIGLGWLGGQPAEGGYVIAARILTFWYFAHFVIILPVLGLVEKPRTLPNSISEAVLKSKGLAASLLLALALGATALVGAPSQAIAQENAHESPQPPREKWSFAGPFGKFDRAQVQRGLKVYREVCSACHSMNLVAFRNLADKGGPEFMPAQAAAIAKEYKIKDGPNDAGDMFERDGRPADKFPSPFANENAGRAANGGAYPPDMSLLAKARDVESGFPWFIVNLFTQYQEGGPDYIHGILNGYEDEAPAGVTLPEGTYYNKYFPGNAIKMPKPLSDDQVPYTDGTPQTVAQYSRDISAFLMWAAEPQLEARKQLGLQVMIFLIVLSTLLYLTKTKIWHEGEKPRETAAGQDPRATSI